MIINAINGNGNRLIRVNKDTNKDAVKEQKGLKLIESVNNRSKANFVQRLNNSERQHIQDWENPNKIATHKMSWATEGEKAIVFPMVQEINGSLHDFSNPKYNHKKWDALNNAINKGDTLMMTSDQAKWFTENYKNYYPKFRNGGVGSFKSDKSMRQEADNTYIEKPKIVEKIPFNFGTVFQDKDGDWLSSTQGRVYKDKYGNIATEEEYKDYLENTSNEFDRFTGRPIAKELINVYPEMALAGFVRAGMMGALPSFKNSAISTASGITSREVKDKMLKGLEKVGNAGEKIDKTIENTAKTIVTKGARAVVPRLPERMQNPAMRAINFGWNFATSRYVKAPQMTTINGIVNE